MTPPARKSFPLRLDPALYAALERAAAADLRSVNAEVEVLLREAVAHGAAGSRWYRWHCERAGVEPRARFRELLHEYATGVLHKPFNTEARLEAGFDIEELESLLAAAD